MPDVIPADSVGIVAPEIVHFDQPLSLTSGGVIDAYDLIYETYGELNADDLAELAAAPGLRQRRRARSACGLGGRLSSTHSRWPRERTAVSSARRFLIGGWFV